MTHRTVDYSKSPAKAFDAVQDIKDYLGDRYDAFANIIKGVTEPAQFALACCMVGIDGYPIKAWFEHFHGEGSWVAFD